MKKKISLFLALALTLAGTSTHAFAGDKVSITTPYHAKQQLTLDKDTAPVLSFETSSDVKKDFSFGLILSGAQWSDAYGNTGIVPDTNGGVTYTKIKPNHIVFEVNTEAFHPSETSLHIPLYSTLKTSGKITVSLDRRTSPFSINPMEYAYIGDPDFRVDLDTVKNIRTTQVMGNITIQDDTMKPVYGGAKYTLKLNNGFTFKTKPQLELIGKYYDDVTSVIDEDDPSIAYLEVTRSTDSNMGTIILSGAEIGPSKSSTIGDIDMTFSRDGKEQSFTVGHYILPSSYEAPICISTFEGGKKPLASGSAAPDKILQIRIDNDNYGQVTVDQDGAWYYNFPFEFSNLKSGTHTFEVGYYQPSVDKWFSPTSRKFEIEAEKTTTTITFPIGTNYYTYDGRKGYLDSPSFTDTKGRTMLPLRAVANILGIENKNIIWNAQTQTIQLSQQNKTVVCTVGSKTMTINGIEQTIDTAPIIKDGRTFLPLRGVINAFGIADNAITWDATTKTVSFEK